MKRALTDFENTFAKENVLKFVMEERTGCKRSQFYIIINKI